MKLSASTLLDVAPERAWAAVQEPALLKHVAAPLLRFDPVDPPTFPGRWAAGDYLVELRLFGVVPLGRQYVRIRDREVEETPTGRIYRIRDDGTGDLVETWDHRITLRETPDGLTVYTDEVEIEAGLLTPAIWLFAALFYRYRQYRWRRLVARWPQRSPGPRRPG